MTLRNALEGLSTESTLAELLEVIVSRADAGGDAGLISGTKVRYRREFNDPALPAFDVVTGPGMTVSTAGGALVVTSGTTPGAVTTITTKQTFSAPFRAAFGVKLSQKLLNQEFYVEAVAVNADGTLDETVVAAWRMAGVDATSTTSARVEVRNGGPARTQSGTITVSSHGVDSIAELVLESDEVQFHTRPADNTGARIGSTVRNNVSPDPTRRYALRYRIVNGATAPASSSTMTSAFLTCLDYTELQVELTGGPGNQNGSSALSVLIAGGNVGVSNGTIGASPSVTGTSPFKVGPSSASTNATLLKNSGGRIYGYQFANTSAAWRYVKFYNLTTLPVPGTSAVYYTVPLAPNSCTDLEQAVPIAHTVGIGYAITAGAADNDTTVVAAGDVVGHIQYS